MTHDGFIWFGMATAYALMAAAGAWKLGIMRQERAMKRRTVALESAELLEWTFRRPAEFGPLLRPWDEIEHMRVAILADQLAVSVRAPYERADLEKGAGVDERAVISERTEQHERVLYWLAHWQDHVLSLTGRGLPA